MAAPIDYSVGGSIDDALHERTRFSSLMRPDVADNEPFVETMSTATHGSSKKGIKHNVAIQTGVWTMGSSTGTTSQADQRDAHPTFASEDMVRGAYIDSIARNSLKESKAQADRSKPKTNSARSNPPQSPAERMAERLRRAHIERSDGLVFVASEEEEQDNFSAPPSFVPIVVEEAAPIPLKIQIAPPSPAERMAARLNRPRAKGSGSLVLVASDEDNGASSGTVEKKAARTMVQKQRIPSCPARERVANLIGAHENKVARHPLTLPKAPPSPAERMATRLNRAREQGSDGLVFVASEEEKPDSNSLSIVEEEMQGCGTEIEEVNMDYVLSLPGLGVENSKSEKTDSDYVSTNVTATSSASDKFDIRYHLVDKKSIDEPSRHGGCFDKSPSNIGSANQSKAEPVTMNEATMQTIKMSDKEISDALKKADKVLWSLQGEHVQVYAVTPPEAPKNPDSRDQTSQDKVLGKTQGIAEASKRRMESTLLRLKAFNEDTKKDVPVALLQPMEVYRENINKVPGESNSFPSKHTHPTSNTSIDMTIGASTYKAMGDSAESPPPACDDTFSKVPTEPKVTTLSGLERNEVDSFEDARNATGKPTHSTEISTVKPQVNALLAHTVASVESTKIETDLSIQILEPLPCENSLVCENKEQDENKDLVMESAVAGCCVTEALEPAREEIMFMLGEKNSLLSPSTEAASLSATKEAATPDEKINEEEEILTLESQSHISKSVAVLYQGEDTSSADSHSLPAAIDKELSINTSDPESVSCCFAEVFTFLLYDDNGTAKNDATESSNVIAKMVPDECAKESTQVITGESREKVAVVGGEEETSASIEVLEEKPAEKDREPVVGRVDPAFVKVKSDGDTGSAYRSNDTEEASEQMVDADNDHLAAAVLDNESLKLEKATENCTVVENERPEEPVVDTLSAGCCAYDSLWMNNESNKQTKFATPNKEASNGAEVYISPEEKVDTIVAEQAGYITVSEVTEEDNDVVTAENKDDEAPILVNDLLEKADDTELVTALDVVTPTTVMDAVNAIANVETKSELAMPEEPALGVTPVVTAVAETDTDLTEKSGDMKVSAPFDDVTSTVEDTLDAEVEPRSKAVELEESVVDSASTGCCAFNSVWMDSGEDSDTVVAANDKDATDAAEDRTCLEEELDTDLAEKTDDFFVSEVKAEVNNVVTTENQNGEAPNLVEDLPEKADDTDRVTILDIVAPPFTESMDGKADDTELVTALDVVTPTTVMDAVNAIANVETKSELAMPEEPVRGVTPVVTAVAETDTDLTEKSGDMKVSAPFDDVTSTVEDTLDAEVEPRSKAVELEESVVDSASTGCCAFNSVWMDSGEDSDTIVSFPQEENNDVDVAKPSRNPVKMHRDTPQKANESKVDTCEETLIPSSEDCISEWEAKLIDSRAREEGEAALIERVAIAEVREEKSVTTALLEEKSATQDEEKSIGAVVHEDATVKVVSLDDDAFLFVQATATASFDDSYSFDRDPIIGPCLSEMERVVERVRTRVREGDRGSEIEEWMRQIIFSSKSSEELER